jgi:hypothetical protein
MYDFTNKYISLILTCNKPAYNERRQKNQKIYEQIHNAGFEIIFLYANSNATELHIKREENGYYTMTVPTEETYTNLAVKMYIAYSFFATQDIKGILKVDDDVYYIEDECLDLDYYDVDYLGASRGLINNCLINNKIYINEYYHTKFCSELSLPHTFFGGPFYWISKKAIEYIIELKIDPSLFTFAEDAFVGTSLIDMAGIKIHNTEWYEMKCVLFTH